MLLFAILAVAMAQSATPAPTVAQGTNSGIEDPVEVVVRSQAEWDRLWKSHGGAQSAPPVDFSKELVAGVFLGTRSSAGFSVEIAGYRRDGSALVIDYVERVPAAGAIVAQVLTSPYHIVRLPRFDGPVRFRRIKSA
jgi:hypothetical protein